MKIFNQKTIGKEEDSCCIKTKIKCLIPRETNAANSDLRLFEMHSTGYSPLHKHLDVHQIFVLDGKGAVFDGEKMMPIQDNDVIFVEANELHQIKNTGEKTLRFICTTLYGKK